MIWIQLSDSKLELLLLQLLLTSLVKQVAVAGSAGGQRLENFRSADGVTSDGAGDGGVPRNLSHLLLQSLESGHPLSRWGSAPTAGSTMALTLARYNSVEQQTTSQAQSEELLGGWE